MTVVKSRDQQYSLLLQLAFSDFIDYNFLTFFNNWIKNNSSIQLTLKILLFLKIIIFKV